MTKSIMRIPTFGWVGIVLLAFSLGCVVWVMRADAGATNDPQVSPTPASKNKVALAFGHVDVEPGVAKLYPLQPGRVSKIFVHDNDVVETDTPLVLLVDTKAKADLDMARAALKAAENDREKAKSLKKLRDAQITGQTAVVAAKKHELEATQLKRDRAKQAFDEKRGGVTKEDLDMVEAMVSSLQEAIKGEEAKLGAFKDINTAPLDESSAEEQIKAKKAQVVLAEFALNECVLKAPCKGTVLRVNVSEGDVLGPNPREPAVLFCPVGPRIIRAEVEQEFANRLFLNQTALIRDDSTNSPALHGKVTRISDWFSHRRSMVQEPLQFNDVRTLECIITLDPSDTALRVGQRVRVTLEAGN